MVTETRKASNFGNWKSEKLEKRRILVTRNQKSINKQLFHQKNVSIFYFHPTTVEFCEEDADHTDT